MTGMKARLRRIALFTKSALLTIVIHGTLLATLFAGWWWPFSENKIEHGSVTPIQARVISAEEIQQQVEAQKKKIEEQQQLAKNLEELKIKRQQEKKKLEELKIKNQEETKKQQELEAQRKRAEQKRLEEIAEKKKAAEAEKKRKDAERKKKLEEEQKRKAVAKKLEEERKRKEVAKKLEEERKRKEVAKKLEAEKKRKEIEKKRTEEALKKKSAEEKHKREQELKNKLEEESELRRQAQTKIDAATAMSALGDRIKEKFKRNWVRPSNSIGGLIATIRVHLSRDGDVLSADVVKPSGNSFFDQSAETAVKKASPLPFPPQPEFYKYIKVLDLEFNPDND